MYCSYETERVWSRQNAVIKVTALEEACALPWDSPLLPALGFPICWRGVERGPAGSKGHLQKGWDQGRGLASTGTHPSTYSSAMDESFISGFLMSSFCYKVEKVGLKSGPYSMVKTSTLVCEERTQALGVLCNPLPPSPT